MRLDMSEDEPCFLLKRLWSGSGLYLWPDGEDDSPPTRYAGPWDDTVWYTPAGVLRMRVQPPKLVWKMPSAHYLVCNHRAGGDWYVLRDEVYVRPLVTVAALEEALAAERRAQAQVPPWLDAIADGRLARAFPDLDTAVVRDALRHRGRDRERRLEKDLAWLRAEWAGQDTGAGEGAG